MEAGEVFGDTGGANKGASEPGEGNEVHARYTSGRKRRIAYCGETGAGIFIEAARHARAPSLCVDW
jgi:hypothetical protein